VKAAVLAVLVSLAACGSSTPAEPSIDNTWIFTNSAGTVGAALTINGSTYVAQKIALTSSTSADDQIETGTITVNASTLDFIPSQWSCAAFMPVDAPYSDGYTLTASGLTLSNSTGFTAFHVDTSGASSNFTSAIGCFLTNGTFQVSPLENVTP
jgi:hypothetical protein